MNWLDIVIIIATVLLAIVGWRTGIISAATTVAGIILGVVLAGQYSGQLAPSLTFLNDENMRNIAAFAGIVLATIIVGMIVGAILKKVISLVFLGWADHLLGLVLGVAFAFFLVGAALTAMGSFPLFGLDKVIDNSKVAPLFFKYMPIVLNMLPEEFRDKIGRFVS